ncbi:hypothetical protein C7A07_02035 [Pseudomonas fragi]|nr:hypothetical protein C7A07_02035 [Pseudomonas fragi]
MTRRYNRARGDYCLKSVGAGLPAMGATRPGRQARVMPSRASPLPHVGAFGNNFNKSPSNQALAHIKRF